MRTQQSHRSTCASLALMLSAIFVPFTALFAQQPAPAGDNGPVLASSEIQQGAILLHFTNADGGLVLKSAGRGAFQVAGADHVWYPAEAHLVNDILVVSTSLVQQPTVVRYTWSTPAEAAVFNRASIPAAPFHTNK